MELSLSNNNQGDKKGGERERQDSKSKHVTGASHKRKAPSASGSVLASKKKRRQTSNLSLDEGEDTFNRSIWGEGGGATLSGGQVPVEEFLSALGEDSGEPEIQVTAVDDSKAFKQVNRKKHNKVIEADVDHQIIFNFQDITLKKRRTIQQELEEADEEHVLLAQHFVLNSNLKHYSSSHTIQEKFPNWAPQRTRKRKLSARQQEQTYVLAQEISRNIGSKNERVRQALYSLKPPRSQYFSHEEEEDKGQALPKWASELQSPQNRFWCLLRELQTGRITPHITRIITAADNSLERKQQQQQQRESSDFPSDYSGLLLHAYLGRLIENIRRNYQDYGDENQEGDEMQFDDYVSETSSEDEDGAIGGEGYDWEKLRNYAGVKMKAKISSFSEDDTTVVPPAPGCDELTYFYPVGATKIPFTSHTQFVEPNYPLFNTSVLRSIREFQESQHSADSTSLSGRIAQNNTTTSVAAAAAQQLQLQHQQARLTGRVATFASTIDFILSDEPALEDENVTEDSIYSEKEKTAAFERVLAYVRNYTKDMLDKVKWGVLPNKEVAVMKALRCVLGGVIEDQPGRTVESQAANDIVWTEAQQSGIVCLSKLDAIQNKLQILLSDNNTKRSIFYDEVNNAAAMFVAAINLLKASSKFAEAAKLSEYGGPLGNYNFEATPLEGMEMQTLLPGLREIQFGPVDWFIMRLKNICLAKKLRKDKDGYYFTPILCITPWGTRSTFYCPEDKKEKLLSFIYEQVDPESRYPLENKLLQNKVMRDQILNSLCLTKSAQLPVHQAKRIEYAYPEGWLSIHLSAEFVSHSQVRPDGNYLHALYTPRARYYEERDIHKERLISYIKGENRVSSSVNNNGNAKGWRSKRKTSNQNIYDINLAKLRQRYTQFRNELPSPCNYFEGQSMDIHHYRLCYDLADREAICMPALSFMQLVNAQGYPERVVKVLLAFFGRVFYKMGGDNWQVMIWLLGPAETGKSTFIEVLRSFIPSMRQGLLQENMEGTFGLWALADAFIWAGADIAENWHFTKEVFQQQVSAEVISIAIKKQKPVPAKPDAHLAIAGNGFPRWHANKRQVIRRILHFPWAKRIPNSSPDLGENIKSSEKPVLMFMTTQAHNEFFRQNADKNIWSQGVLPSFFEENKKHINSATNRHYEFLTSNEVVLYGRTNSLGEKDGIPLPYVPMEQMEEAFRNYCKRMGETKVIQWSPAQYQTAFDDLGLYVKKYQCQYPPAIFGVSTRFCPLQDFVFGCCLKSIIDEIATAPEVKSSAEFQNRSIHNKAATFMQDRIDVNLGVNENNSSSSSSGSSSKGNKKRHKKQKTK